MTTEEHESEQTLEINPDHPGALCPLCDNAVEDWEPWSTKTANGFRYIVHLQCLEEG